MAVPNSPVPTTPTGGLAAPFPFVEYSPAGVDINTNPRQRSVSTACACYCNRVGRFVEYRPNQDFEASQSLATLMSGIARLRNGTISAETFLLNLMPF